MRAHEDEKPCSTSRKEIADLGFRLAQARRDVPSLSRRTRSGSEHPARGGRVPSSNALKGPNTQALGRQREAEMLGNAARAAIEHLGFGDEPAIGKQQRLRDFAYQIGRESRSTMLRR